MADEGEKTRFEREQKTRFEREQEAVLEYFKQAHDTQKHLATLSAGAIVLIGTFLRDIFPRTTDGVLDVGLPTKLLIVASFVCFGVSLATSSHLMRSYTYRYLRTARLEGEGFERLPVNPRVSDNPLAFEHSTRTFVVEILRLISLYTFPLGLAAFGIAVLVTLL